MVLDPVPLTTINDIKVTRGDYSIPTGQLYLRPDHRYRLTITDERGQRIGNQVIDVRTPGQSLTGDPQNRSNATACNVAVAQVLTGRVPCQNP
jgi:hypothetical protein